MLVSAADLLRWNREGRADIIGALVPGHFGQQAFDANHAGVCRNLGMTGSPCDCSIYATRGQSCRDVQPGDRACLGYRRAALQ